MVQSENLAGKLFSHELSTGSCPACSPVIPCQVLARTCARSSWDEQGQLRVSSNHGVAIKMPILDLAISFFGDAYKKDLPTSSTLFLDEWEQPKPIVGLVDKVKRHCY